MGKCGVQLLTSGLEYFRNPVGELQGFAVTRCCTDNEIM